jgi:hypothetical protein
MVSYSMTSRCGNPPQDEENPHFGACKMNRRPHWGRTGSSFEAIRSSNKDPLHFRQESKPVKACHAPSALFWMVPGSIIFMLKPHLMNPPRAKLGLWPALRKRSETRGIVRANIVFTGTL